MNRINHRAGHGARVATIAAGLIASPAAVYAGSPDFVVATEFAPHLRVDDLGTIPGAATVYGGIAFAPGDPDTLLIATGAVEPTGEIYAIGVDRDCHDEIIGFQGVATPFADTPFIDGGLVAGPDGVVLYTTWDSNLLGQIRPGNTAADRLIALGDAGVMPSTGSVTVVPAGFPGAGRVKFASYDADLVNDATLSADGAGTFDVIDLELRAIGVGSGTEGMAYIGRAQPGFGADHLLVNSWDGNRVEAFVCGAAGDPITSTRREILSIQRPEGAARDPRSGNVLISTMDAPDRIVALRLLDRCAPDVVPEGGDGDIGTAELLTVIEDWTASCSSSDIDRVDGVGFGDLLLVLSNWGSCR